MSDRKFFAELRRRNVPRAAAFYAASAWLLVQVATQVFPFFHLPEWVVRWIVVAASVGFPFWILFSWYYEWTPQGLQRESEVPAPPSPVARQQRRNIDRWIIAMLSLAVVLLLANQFVDRQEQRPAPAVPGVPQESIAVLPFTDMSEAKDQGYFSDGISEELLNLLAKIPQLKVAARTSSFSFKEKQVGIPEIARQLNVAHVLEGSIRKSGNQLRITVQLIRAPEGYHIWAETYDRQLEDIFKVQDEIASEVVKQLKVTLLGAKPTVRQTDPKAYALYLQASQLGRQYNPEALTQSDALYRQLFEIDPNYAPAWHGLALNFLNKANLGLLSNSEGYAHARAANEKAVAIDPTYASAYGTLGYIAEANNDFVSAAKHLERALALEPNNTDALGMSAMFLEKLGRLEEALPINEALVQGDPLSLVDRHNLGMAQLKAGRFDASIASFRTVLSLSPGRAAGHYYICVALLLKGDASAALAEIEQEQSEVWRLIGLPMAYHALGRETESDAALAALIAKFEKDWSYNIAYVHAFRGDADKAFEWLDKAIQYEDTGLPGIAVENLFANIHSDPRWLPFLRKIGKAPEQLAQIQFKVTLPSAPQGAK